jgi:hypothetical protein
MKNLPKKTKACPFWETVPLQELAEQQQVCPIEDLDELSGLWPMEDDPDELFRYIAAERAERRRLSPDPG